MQKILLIGYGYWGKKIFQKLKKKFRIKIIKNRSEINNNKILKQNFDLVIISSNTINHLSVIKKIWNKNTKIFCEKPLTYKFKDAKKILQIIKKKEKQIYISEIESFKKLKLKFFKKNSLNRYKNKNYTFFNLLYSLVYHDIYLHMRVLNFYMIKKIKILEEKNFFQISFKCKNKIFEWNYYVNNKKNIHYINGYKVNSKKDFIVPMINYVLKNENFKINNLTALYTIRILEKLYKTWKTNNI